MVIGNLHVERGARVAQVLGGENGALLADEQRGGVRVAADVVLEHVSEILESWLLSGDVPGRWTDPQP